MHMHNATEERRRSAPVSLATQLPPPGSQGTAEPRAPRDSGAAHALPDDRVALKARAKRDLPHAVAAAQLARHRRQVAVGPVGAALVSILRDELELVPDRGGGDVAVPVEREARRLEVVRRQREVLLHRVDDGAASRVDADPLEGGGEVGDVRRQRLEERVLGLLRPGPRRAQLARRAGGRLWRRQRLVGRVGREVDQRAEERQRDERAGERLDGLARLAAGGRPGDHVEEELELLLERQHKRAERRDVALERVARDLHDRLGESDAADAVGVLLLDDRVVGEVVLADVGAHRVQQLEARPPRVRPAVGEQDGRGAAAEERVLQQHAAVVAAVPVLGDVLGGDDERERALLLVPTQQPAREVDRDAARRAAHASEVVGEAVGAHLEVVDEHGGEGGGGAEEGAVDDDDPDVLRRRPRRRQQVRHRLAHHRLRLLARALHREAEHLGVLAEGVLATLGEDGLGEDGHLRDARRLHDFLLELDRLLREARLAEPVERGPRLGHKALLRRRHARRGVAVAAVDAAVPVRLEVDEVDGRRPAHPPDGQQPHGEAHRDRRAREGAARQRHKVEQRLADAGEIGEVVGLAGLAPREVERVGAEQQHREAHHIVGEVARDKAAHDVNPLRDPLVRGAGPLRRLLQRLLRLRARAERRRRVLGELTAEGHAGCARERPTGRPP
mmetsp:Transcript_10631/g.31313  ORF Transcript_10631/g.31313 Transcript_10631/m.31313 type:complete len:675 (-) Transcript_10631:10-2034(-)